MLCGTFARVPIIGSDSSAPWQSLHALCSGAQGCRHLSCNHCKSHATHADELHKHPAEVQNVIFLFFSLRKVSWVSWSLPRISGEIFRVRRAPGFRVSESENFWEFAKGGAKRIVRFWGGGETYYKVPPPKPVLEASESGICLVCARFL